MLQESEQDRLLRELNQLHEMLEGTDEIDKATTEAMRLVAADMSRVLNKQEEATDDTWPGFGKRWREAVLHFESQHPRLAQVVEQITSVLAGAGISVAPQRA